MNKIFILLISIIISISGAGCAWVFDFPKTVWGSSTRVLNARRDQGETKIFSCSIADAYDTVLALTRPFGEKQYANVSEAEAAAEAKKEKPPFVLFQQHPCRRWMVVMGVPEAVDTTEVGIFFESTADGQTKIDVVSLSGRAQKTAASIIFERLASRFGSAEGR